MPRAGMRSQWENRQDDNVDAALSARAGIALAAVARQSLMQT